ncbi:hypothetical protein DU508_00190 [Pedobacter chinensis]|uniref:DUF5723 domain-containing protein n=1 Tax=Pedobacter chinensis TaxID=2282421 RepID=A0A369Q0K4_9SPHI|nr:DUF5723 family protein [Pedobacter chinensis]RDC58461.1 hypothetical protein DU508_00190 [Pedobacter chinensis]
MKKLLLAVLIIISFHTLRAQQYSLFGTKTMFDAFENPSQKSFILDSSRRFSSNFFLPYFGVNGANRGDAEYVVRRLTQAGVNDTRSLSIGTGAINHIYTNNNIYVATFRIFQSYKYQKEMGFAWQIRSDAHVDYTNETLAIFDTYTRFPAYTELNDIFNTKGYQQSYHQFSFTYRENYNKRLAFGIKASLLSGILYNDLDIKKSNLYISPETNSLLIGVNGTYSSNFNDIEEINKKTFFPNFKNPGLSLSFGTNYTTQKGLFLMANVKDLGFVWWRSETQRTIINQQKIIEDIGFNQANTNEEIRDIFLLSQQSKKFLAATNAKLDVYVSKTYGFYKPGLIVSKNLFYKGGDIALVNTFNYNNLSASVTPLYNLNDIFMVGLQGKYQTPNFELFGGTDNLFSTASQVRGIISNSAKIGKGPNGASFYMGIGIKFGNVVNHPQFSDVMPGINDNEGRSFFKNLISIFKRN